MAANGREGSAQDRLGNGVSGALHRAFPASAGAAIRAVYPPDAACDERFEALIKRVEQIPAKRRDMKQ